MTISVSNSNLVDTGTPASPTTLAFTSSPTVNSGLIVTYQTDSGLTVNTPTDTLTNTYTLLVHADGTGTSNFDVYIWLVKKNKSTGANTVSISWTGAATFSSMRISEIKDNAGNSGGFNSDQIQTGSNAGSANPSITTPATTVANELIYGGQVSGGANGTVGAGYTSIQPGVNTSGQDEWKTVTSTGTQVVNFTNASAGWTMAAATIFTIPTSAGSLLTRPPRPQRPYRQGPLSGFYPIRAFPVATTVVEGTGITIYRVNHRLIF